MNHPLISKLLATALALATAFTLSCSGGDDGGGNGNGSTNANTVESSSSNDGSSSSQPQENISSSETPSSSSSGSVEDSTANSSSSDHESGSSSSSNGMIKKAKISGVFQKGPFIAGTTATLNELDNELNPTGRPYQTLITDDKGTFELRNVELVSPYAHLIASGFYRNEVTGNKSAAPITLQAIVDLRDRDNVNVNILTHLEYYRVLDLVDGGMTVKAAKKQAQKEIFAVFGMDSDKFKDSEDMTIFGTSESDAALLAVSILLLGNLSEADFSQRLMNFAQGIRTSGGWDNEAEKQAMANWALINANVKGIKNNIVAWGLSSAVPDFDKFVYDYWVGNYGMGVCNDEKYGYTDKNLICKNEVWEFLSLIDLYCVENKNCDFFTDIRDGNKYWVIKIDEHKIISNLRYRGASGNLGTFESRYSLYYSWDEVLLTGCPAGSHLPSKEELDELDVPCSYGDRNSNKNLRLDRIWSEDGRMLGASCFGWGEYDYAWRASYETWSGETNPNIASMACIVN
jgi:uncharacterized protein (TIGR02145 family)